TCCQGGVAEAYLERVAAGILFSWVGDVVKFVPSGRSRVFGLRPGSEGASPTMPEPTRIDRARGCLLGLAVGDALGAPLEGLSTQQIRAHYGLVTDYVDGAKAWKKKPFRWRYPGLYSDDTQQALVLCDVLLEQHRIDPVRLAELYLDLAASLDVHP